jgi:hypothetical protein
MDRMNGLLAIGAMFVFAGLLGFATPAYTTQAAETVAAVGELHLTYAMDTSQAVPQFLSGGVLAMGLILIGTSLYQKR